jgi:hypothetical protein
MCVRPEALRRSALKTRTGMDQRQNIKSLTPPIVSVDSRSFSSCMPAAEGTLCVQKPRSIDHSALSKQT